MISVQQVADRLSVHPETVKRWLRAGDLVGYALGDRAGWRVREDDLDAFLQVRRNRGDDDRQEVDGL